MTTRPPWRGLWPRKKAAGHTPKRRKNSPSSTRCSKRWRSPAFPRKNWPAAWEPRRRAGISQRSAPKRVAHAAQPPLSELENRYPAVPGHRLLRQADRTGENRRTMTGDAVHRAASVSAGAASFSSVTAGASGRPAAKTLHQSAAVPCNV